MNNHYHFVVRQTFDDRIHLMHNVVRHRVQRAFKNMSMTGFMFSCPGLDRFSFSSIVLKKQVLAIRKKIVRDKRVVRRIFLR